jgi:hypothetical protein
VQLAAPYRWPGVAGAVAAEVAAAVEAAGVAEAARVAQVAADPAVHPGASAASADTAQFPNALTNARRHGRVRLVRPGHFVSSVA